MTLEGTERTTILSRLQATGLSRRKQLSTRVIIAAIGAGILWFQVGPFFACLYLAAIAVSQTFDFWVWRPVCDTSRSHELKRGELRKLWLGSFQAGACYSLLAAFLWFYGDTGARIFAVMWLMGGLLHTTLHMYHERQAFYAGITPHAIYAFALPASSFFLPGGVGIGNAALVLFGIVLYGMHLFVAFRASAQASEALSVSRQEALDRQAAAEAANAAKSAFLANMSHEIRTPLNGIIGMADVVQTHELPDETRSKVQIIRESGDVLLQLLNDILDVSKIEAGQLDIEFAPFDLADIARKVGNLHGLKAREKGVDFDIIVAPSMATRRIGDVHRLTQVLHNLTSNALKFTDRGGVRIEFREASADPGRVEITVADSGIGMSEDQLAKIFSAFVQADSSTSRRFGGTGLGLSITSGLVEVMEGEISATSEPGKGATFTVSLPLPVDTDEMTESVGDAKAQVDGLSLRDARILVADDNHVNRIVLQSLLMPTGAAVVLAENGAEALSHAGAGAFDLVLMDISMPVMDGPDAMRLIRQRLGESAPPIVAVSAHALSHEVEAYLAQGFNGYLTKPVGADPLYQEIRRVLSLDATASGEALAG